MIFVPPLSIQILHSHATASIRLLFYLFFSDRPRCSLPPPYKISTSSTPMPFLTCALRNITSTATQDWRLTGTGAHSLVGFLFPALLLERHPSQQRELSWEHPP